MAATKMVSEKGWKLAEAQVFPQKQQSICCRSIMGCLTCLFVVKHYA